MPLHSTSNRIRRALLAAGLVLASASANAALTSVVRYQTYTPTPVMSNYSVTCNAGEISTGGGYTVPGLDYSAGHGNNLVVAASVPYSTVAQGWTVSMKVDPQDPAHKGALSVYVVCAKAT